MTRCQMHAATVWRGNGPIDAGPIISGIGIRAGERRRLIGAPFKLSKLLALLAGLECHSITRLDLGDDASDDFTLQRLLGDVGRQPAGVMHDEPHAICPWGEGLNASLENLQPWRDQQVPDEPPGKPLDLMFQERGRWIAKGEQLIPPTQFNRAELRMLDRVPVDIS